MATSSRRVGAETSKTRDTLLDCVETMMLEEGYASVTYRALAAKAGVTPSLVQYYFPSLDDIFVAAIRRYSERNLAYLDKILAKRTDDPLRALWEYSWDEATGTLITEFMALANHRKSIRTEIAAVTEGVRKLQLEALTAKFGEGARPWGDLSLPALQLLISSLPKFLNLEKGVGVESAHAELTEAFEGYLDSIEPKPKSLARKRSR
ncbi:TetR family transcriptional regulator [Mycolicibacterium duvalii]|uniref:TetR family transcriptional regulator n=1 Tax=Mycolicibacterium duvalii TaxID=39688 RepID=A0A7I7K8F1_9MYCO|nr:TetR/AcrR family transcriptional regulator [Mycolicibacterium duvalii]MCV7368185.1 TetR/AcrR family transcriptional regulator [Mycolicibacterium duvalii]PEG43336.1 TetR family transcriptional regulator [Mycolicibacterium duvalii]BBX19839.1 TetR family transcriptional regulator [Mycolicibacterium duvalii]